MQKLRDAKKIKWSESYTEKSGFLRDQFNAVVGKGSYKRYEGKEIGGPGEWYAVISPADVHEHKRAKFFAGVRKLPDSYPAGGKYFDTIKEAYEYSFDTWGTPKPENIPHYTSGDLKGIAKRIEKWKNEQERKEEQEEQEEVTASIPFDIFRIRRAMGLAAVYKDDLVFDFKIFLPLLENITLSSPNACDIFYDRLLAAAGYSNQEEVIKELDENRSKNSNYAKTRLPSGKTVSWNEENFGFAKDMDDRSEDPRNTKDPDELRSLYRFAAKAVTVGRKKRRNIFESIYKKPGTFENVNLENIDSRALRSNFEEAILSAYNKYLRNIGNIGRCYDFTMYMYEKYSSQFTEKKRENLRDTILFERGGEKPPVEPGTPTPKPITEERMLTFDEFTARLSSTDPKDAEFVKRWSISPDRYPVKMFVTYSRRDSACRYWVSAPYNSERAFYRRYSIVPQSFDKDANGFDQIDYSLLYATGRKMESFVPRMRPVKIVAPEGSPEAAAEKIEKENERNQKEAERIAKLVEDSRTFIASLGDIPEKIRIFLKSSEITLPGRRTTSAISQNLEPKQFGNLLDEIVEIVREKVPEFNLREGFKNIFKGWGKYIKGKYIVERDLNQRVEAKRFGAYYFGKKDVHDKVSSGEILQLFQEQSEGVFSDKPVPVTEVIKALINFKGYEGLGADKQNLIQSLINNLTSFGESQKVIDFDKFNEFIQQLGLRDVFRKDDILYLFSEALKIGGQVPTSRPAKEGREDLHTTISRSVGQRAKNYRKSKVLTPFQTAVIQYADKAGWDKIKTLLGWERKYKGEEKQEKYISTIKLTRILRDQTEDVMVSVKDEQGNETQELKKIRIFSDEDIRNLITLQKSKVAKTSFDDYRTLLDRGDVVLNTFTNGDRIDVSRLTLSDFAYWKILKNKFRNMWNLLERNPKLYESILRNFFIPTELRGNIEAINAPIFFSKSEKNSDGTLKQVTEDKNGNKLLFINDQIKIKFVDPKGKISFIDPEDVGDYSVTASKPSEENIKLIEEALEKYFSDPTPTEEGSRFKTKGEENRSKYQLTSSFIGYLPENATRPTLFVRNYSRSNDFTTRIRQLETVQQKVMFEMFKDMSKGVMLPPGVENPDEVTSEHNKMLQSLSLAIEGAKKKRPGEEGREYSSKDFLDKFKKAKSVFEKFLKWSGESPYSIEDYWSAYESQISPSTVVNLTSSLGFYVWREVAGEITEDKKTKKRVSSEIDFTRNPKNAALVTNIPYGVFCDRASQSINAPKNVAFSNIDLQDPDSEVMGQINSKDLAIAFAIRFNRKATQDELSRFEIAFESASISRGKLVGLLRSAALKRMQTNIIYEYDPLISKSTVAKDADVWYKVWREPDYGQAAFIITANYLLSWLHEGSVNKEMLAKILGVDDEKGGGGVVGEGWKDIEEIFEKALSSSKILGEVVEKVPINPIQVDQVEKQVEEETARKATEEPKTEMEKVEDSKKEESQREDEDKPIPVIRKGEPSTEEAEAEAEETSAEKDSAEEVAAAKSGEEDVGGFPTTEPSRLVPPVTRLPTTAPSGDLEDFEEFPGQEPSRIAPILPSSLPSVPPVGGFEGEEETGGQIETPEQRRKRRLREIQVKQSPGKGSEGEKKSKSLLSLMRVAKVFSDKNQDDKAEAIIEFVKNHIESNSSDESSKNIAVLQALSNLVYVSKTMVKRGKVKEAEEINKIIKKHIGIITSSEQGT